MCCAVLGPYLTQDYRMQQKGSKHTGARRDVDSAQQGGLESRKSKSKSVIEYL